MRFLNIFFWPNFCLWIEHPLPSHFYIPRHSKCPNSQFPHFHSKLRILSFFRFPQFKMRLSIISTAFFLLLLQNANLSPIFHRLFKREFNEENAFKELLQIDQNDTTNPEELLRLRLVEIAAFGYSLLQTYSLVNSASNNSKLIGDFAAKNVPEPFKTFFGPSKNANDRPSQTELEDLQCFDKCLQKMQERAKQKMGVDGLLGELGSGGGNLGGRAFGGGLAKINCSDEMDARICLVNCRQNSKESGGSIFLKFLIVQMDWFLGEYCPPNSNGQIDLLEILSSCQIRRIPGLAFGYTFTFGREFVGQFNKANEQKDEGQKCRIVKEILIDEFAGSMSAICNDSRQAKLMKEMLRTTAGYVIAKNTEGAILRRCPEIYN